MSCPICNEAGTESYRPFCSKRCADIDLAKWLNGSYAIESARESDPAEIERALNQALLDDLENKSEKPH